MLRERIRPADERGTTMVEMVVGMAVGMVVVSALTGLIVVSLHASARVSARVHATQNARLSLVKIMEQLHSACVTPKIAPVRAESTGTMLRFSHSTASEGSAAGVKPILSEIVLNNGTLTETNYPSIGGTPPGFSEIASGTQVLATRIVPTPPATSIFSYFSYLKGNLVEIPQKELGVLEANSVIQVKVAFTGLPASTSTVDSSVGASVENSAMLRLTPPSFNEAAGSPPCQ